MVVYIDDLFVFSKNAEDYYKHVETVPQRLKENECSFFMKEVEFLGMVVREKGIRVGDDLIEIVKAWPKPLTLTELRSFVDLLQFFRAFIERLLKISDPINQFDAQNKGIRYWDECDSAFQKLKEAMISAPILVAPD